MAATKRDANLDEAIPRDIRSALLKYDESKDEGAEAYSYSPLPKDKKRIRLLRLYPDVLKSPSVTCKMFEAEFVPGQKLPRLIDFNGQPTDRGIEYEALSWRWGDEDNSEYTIMIRNDYKIYKKRVSQTLGLALKYLRRGEDRILWIDAICIDQKNKEERSYQVSMMSLVYTRALQVCVWLGEDDDNSQKAFKFIREDITHLKDFDQLCNDQQHAHKWRAFVGLMQRDWFSRRWVVQEIALAPKASVYCGPDELEWRELAIAVELFVEVETATHRLSELLRKDDKSRVVPNWFEHISELGASLLVNATARIFREYQRGDQIVRGPARRSLLSLEFLVTSLSIFDCGRPHDSVYALIAIARDASPNPPTSVKQRRRQALIQQVFGDQLEEKPYLLDYHSPYPDVCKDFVQFCIERCAKLDSLQALDILCRPWAKDWRPGEFKMDEDKRPLPSKRRIFEVQADRTWEISWSQDATELFQYENGRLVNALNSMTQPVGNSALAPEAAPASTPAGDDDQASAGATESIPTPSPENLIGHGEASTLVYDRPVHYASEEWRQAWELYKDQRIKLGDDFDALSPVAQRPKTHADKREMSEYRDQQGFTDKNPVSDFISRAFPKRQGVNEALKTEARPTKKHSHEWALEEEKWKEQEVDALTALEKDPKLEDILIVKSELATIDQYRAERAKLKIGVGNTSKTPDPTTIDEKREEKGIKELGLPSWVAKIDCAPFDIFPHPGMDMLKMGRKNADPLVGVPQDGHRNYSAGQTKEVELENIGFKRRAHLGHYSLYLKGFSFDRVAKVAQVSQAGAIPASWLDLAGWSEARRHAGLHGNLDDPPDAFWRTLVADRGRNDRNPPYYYARACKETILKGGIRSNAVDTTALIYNERNSIIAEFCRRVQAVIWNRALIKTKKGALGLVTEHVREGDLVCIIYGCTVPVILRRENAKFKSRNEVRNERLEDGIETMKRGVAQMERYRERKKHHSKLSVENRAKIKDYRDKYMEDNPPRKDPAMKAERARKLRELEEERELLFGGEDGLSDIEYESSASDIEEEARQTQEEDDDDDDEAEKPPLTDEEKAEKEARNVKAEAKIKRQIERERKAKVRDPLRHYRFLDQAYIHGMMDGEAVRQKFYTGKPDHMFEIR
jgi:hypothetical protein